MLRHPGYTLSLIRKKISFKIRYRWISRHAGKNCKVPMPLVYKLELTHECNLRCKMCFQWGHEGWCRREKQNEKHEELDWDIIEQLFAAAGRTRPDIILIGGEPLLYSRFRDLACLIKKHRCHANICTNGIQLNRFTEVFAKNQYLSLLVSLDGLQETNDLIRGAGVYQKVTDNIKTLKRLKHPPYIGIQHTIRPENVDRLQDFCKEMTNMGVDWILLNPFWFINGHEASGYERFIRDNYGFCPSKHLGFCMPYNIDRSIFMEQFHKIRNDHLPVQVSCYLRNPEEINTYIDDAAALVKDRRCYKQWIRAEITPAGDVSPCIQFPDLIFGNLHDKTMAEIWNSPVFGQFRKRALMTNHPLCGKCNSIYLYDAWRNHL
jgi:MoaA/NifB/PqqE/SkfB family radical SAM enzyme